MKPLMLIFFLVCFSGLLNAHQTSDSFLSIKQADKQLLGEWHIPLDVLDTLQGKALALDQNQDMEITWGELLFKQTQITKSVFSSLKFSQNGHVCETKPGSFQLDQLNTGLYLFFPFSIHCKTPLEADGTDAAIENSRIEYQLFFQQDPQHRGLLRFSEDKKTNTHVFSPTSPTYEIGNNKRSASFVQFVKEGIWHIWIGLDHILFLLALLLPAVFIFDAGVRKVQGQFKPVLIDVLKVVTGFTIAHSITLTLAALKLINLPSMTVEILIAVSVALSGLLVFSPRFHRYRWRIAFGFGLIHGFGFASVLLDLKLPLESFAAGMLAFNIGVELGQLAIVSLVLPLIFVLRKYRFYINTFLPLTAFSMVLIGIIWFLERSMEWQIISFT